MDYSYARPKLGDLRQSRSRDNSQTSFDQSPSGALNLNIAAALHAHPSSHQDSVPSSVPSLSTNPSSNASSPAFLTCPVPNLPISSHGTFAQDWSFLNTSQNTHDPLLNFTQSEQPQVASSGTQVPQAPPTGIFTPEEMSTLGIQFDPRFDAAIRPSYTWPTVYDMNEHYNQQDNTAMDPFSMPSTNTHQSFPRSFSSSPPQAIFTPEQRELKRQRDLARRESKTRMRRDRSASNSYNNSQNTTPDILPRTIADYSSTIVASSLTTESSPPFTSPSYMPNLAPQLSKIESPELYGGTSFPTISTDYNGYLLPFTSAPEVPSYTMPHISRPHSHSTASDSSFHYSGASVTVNPLVHSHTHPHDHSHSQSSAETVRVVHSRPKPQCWEHGCNGRQFSTFSNLLRHQREKSGVASKPTCPKCGAEFTRTTARNGHMAHEKCKQRRNS